MKSSASSPIRSQRIWSVTEADLGRVTVTGVETDRYVFRVPSLRNVAVTAPYFHDGRASSLTAAIEIMARIQLGRELPVQDVRSIAAFLETLTGEYQGRSLAGKPAAICNETAPHSGADDRHYPARPDLLAGPGHDTGRGPCTSACSKPCEALL